MIKKLLPFLIAVMFISCNMNYDNHEIQKAKDNLDLKYSAVYSNGRAIQAKSYVKSNGKATVIANAKWLEDFIKAKGKDKGDYFFKVYLPKKNNNSASTRIECGVHDFVEYYIKYMDTHQIKDKEGNNWKCQIIGYEVKCGHCGYLFAYIEEHSLGAMPFHD
ncbi:MAG: hypothetical protein CR988_02060 [Treponema sp.]|nr:MAG: hypothetical protein CR988_02060 [Treponema sp.]